MILYKKSGLVIVRHKILIFNLVIIPNFVKISSQQVVAPWRLQ